MGISGYVTMVAITSKLPRWFTLFAALEKIIARYSESGKCESNEDKVLLLGLIALCVVARPFQSPLKKSYITPAKSTPVRGKSLMPWLKTSDSEHMLT